MQEYVSLPLAKDIASRYERLGVEAPKAGKTTSTWDGPGYQKAGKTTSTWDEPGYQNLKTWNLYTAAEIFSELPPVVGIEKVYTKYHAGETVSLYRAYTRKNNGESAQVESDSLVEALGKLWLRVLDERIMEEGK